jgi:hypothetical protein
VAATAAAVWAAAVTYLPVLAFAMLAGGGVGAVTRLAAAGWLLAHGVPITVGAERVSLVPLLLTGVALWRLGRAGVHASRAVGGHRARTMRRALTAALAVGLAYAGLGAIVAAWVGAPVGGAAMRLGVLASAAAGLGVLVHTRAGRLLSRRAPQVVRDAVRTGVSAAALVLAIGAAAAGTALAIRGVDAATMLGSYRAGVIGQAGITLLCLAYAPNLAVWGAAYLLGPGFALGVGTVVSPGLVAVGPVPTVPIFAALPQHAISGAASALLGVPLVAAMGAGVALARQRAGAGWTRLLAGAALGGPVGGVLLQTTAVASGGSLGSDRLAQIGPTGSGVGLWGALVLGVGAVVGAAAIRAVRRTPAASVDV